MKYVKLTLILLMLAAGTQLLMAQVSITGEKKLFHKITLTADGPAGGENEATFKDHRMTVTFKHSGGHAYTLSGYFAADGDAANTSATSGNKWRCHFRPDAVGTWTYTISFLKGTDIALKANSDNSGGTPVAPNGETGTLDVAASDKTGKDFRNPQRGMLRYVDKHYLKYSGSNRWFIRGGPGTPENPLAYNEFDNQVNRRDYGPHKGDWKAGDPTWNGDKGKGIIGMANYLAGTGANTWYVISNNIAGDGRDTWPYAGTDYNSVPKNSPDNHSNPTNWPDRVKKAEFDVSKLEQWDIVVTHMNNVGVVPLWLFLEKENEMALDDNEKDWKLTYREMSARFGHHSGITWVMCEEMVRSSTDLAGSKAIWLSGVDGYSHPIGTHHPGLGNYKKKFVGELAGNRAKNYACLQGNCDNYKCIRAETKELRNLSTGAGKYPELISWDEPRKMNGGDQGLASSTVDMHRIDVLWGGLLAGAMGVSTYGSNDVGRKDYTWGETFWNQCGHAIDFMWDNAVPLGDMAPDDDLVSNGYCLAKTGVCYVIQLPNGGSTSLELPGGNYRVKWFNPKTGEYSNESTLSGGGSKSLGSAPDNGDWVVLVENAVRVVPEKSQRLNSVKAEIQYAFGNIFLVLGPAKPGDVEVSFYDTRGRQITSFMERVSGGQKKIHLNKKLKGRSELPEGRIFVKVSAGRENVSFDFINMD